MFRVWIYIRKVLVDRSYTPAVTYTRSVSDADEQLFRPDIAINFTPRLISFAAAFFINKQEGTLLIAVIFYSHEKSRVCIIFILSFSDATVYFNKLCCNNAKLQWDVYIDHNNATVLANSNISLDAAVVLPNVCSTETQLIINYNFTNKYRYSFFERTDKKNCPNCVNFRDKSLHFLID